MESEREGRGMILLCQANATAHGGAFHVTQIHH